MSELNGGLQFGGPHLTRLRNDQTDQIARVTELRREAESIKAIVSRGYYGPNEAKRFWAIAKNASFILDIANPELAQRAGLGSGFFTTVVRDKRNPKLQNFLAALGVIVELSNDRLRDVDAATDFGKGLRSLISDPISSLSRDHVEISQLAVSLARMARDEIVRIVAEPANHPDTIARQKKEVELLEIFAEGFDRIANLLSQYSKHPHDGQLLANAENAVVVVEKQLNGWLQSNASEIADWAIRLPVLVGGVAALGWAGANMAVGTTAVAALVGGKKVVEAIGAIRKAK